MSGFVRQHTTVNAFSCSDSWVILSPIEQSIKQKIEAVGTPLKDWDINIYRGVLTGYNEAFIIDTKKRDEILDNCSSDEERKKTAELIRPILRGRDIKRYGYDWANLWLICTHNGVKGKFPRIDVKDYPAIKAHLDTFGSKVTKRSDQGDTPYNLRNCAYWEDFDKPKIVYMEIQTDNEQEGYPFPCYSFDDNHTVIMNTGYIMTSDTIDVRYILGVLNSKLGKFLTKMYVSQLQQRQFRMLAQFVTKFPIVLPNEDDIKFVSQLVQNQLNQINKESEINHKVYSLYNLSDEEIDFIEKWK
jgi:hypothetical protein